ncbi:hypothetical protein ACJMK2_020341 [Sinanodonta woodiana]|uniref:Uncharacterized protein n=1 Tax=Sinanodonta woodiana TaxID=1069815 RepID=A0ABD3U0H8_SINWO
MAFFGGRLHIPSRNIYTCRHETLKEVSNYFVEKLSLNCSKWPWSRVMGTRALGIDHLIVFQHGELYSESVYEEISFVRESLLHAKRIVIVSVCTDEGIFEHDKTCKMERVYSKDGLLLFEFHVLPFTWDPHNCTANILTKLHTFWLRFKTPGAERKFYINSDRVRCICVDVGLGNVLSTLFRSMGRRLKCGSWHDVLVGKHGKNGFLLLVRSGQMPTAEQRKIIEKRLPEAQYTIIISACVKGDVRRISPLSNGKERKSTVLLNQRPTDKEKTSHTWMSNRGESNISEMKTFNYRPNQRRFGSEISQGSTLASNQSSFTVSNILTRQEKISKEKGEHIQICKSKHSSIRVDHKQFTYLEIHILRGFQNDVIIPPCQMNISTIQDLQCMFRIPSLHVMVGVCYNESLKGIRSLLCRELHLKIRRKSWLTTVGRNGKDWNLLIFLPGKIPRPEEMIRLEKKVAHARFTLFIYVCDKSEKLIRQDLQKTMETNDEQKGHQRPTGKDAETNGMSLKLQSNSVTKDHEDICDESLIIYEKEQFMYFELHVIDGIDTLPKCNTNHRVMEKLKDIIVFPTQLDQN